MCNYMNNHTFCSLISAPGLVDDLQLAAIRKRSGKRSRAGSHPQIAPQNMVYQLLQHVWRAAGRAAARTIDKKLLY